MPTELLPYTCTLSERYIKMAIEELHEDPETRLDKCRELLAKLEEAHPEITPNPDPKFLLRFLRCKKFDVGRAAEMLAQHYIIRYEEPEIFNGTNLKSLKAIHESNIIGLLPKPAKNGSMVMISQSSAMDLEKHKPLDFVRYMAILAEGNAVIEDYQVGGGMSIANYDKYTMRHFTTFMPHMGVFSKIMEKATPSRFKGTVIVNPIAPSIITAVLAVIEKLFSKKFSSRIKVATSNDFSELYEFIDKDNLPPEFGGTLDDDIYERARKYIEECAEFVESQRKFGVCGGKYTIVDNM